MTTDVIVFLITVFLIIVTSIVRTQQRKRARVIKDLFELINDLGYCINLQDDIKSGKLNPRKYKDIERFHNELLKDVVKLGL